MRSLETLTEKRGYGVDATDYAFRRHVLLLLKELRSSIDDMWIMFDNLRDEMKGDKK